MANKSMKKALISSVLVLALCFTMLIGTTFAWFTDSATSTGNTIKTGKLDIVLSQYDKESNSYVDITDDTDPIFDETTLWEPNATHVRYFEIKNNGTLALKFNVALNVYNIEKNLNEVLAYAVIPNADANSVTAWDASKGVDLVEGKNVTTYENKSLLPGESCKFAIAVHMDHNAGNQYQNASVTFDINVIAGQLNYESDSFGPDYDLYSSYPGFGYAIFGANSGGATVEIRGNDGYKVGSATIPVEAVASTNDGEVTVTVEKTSEVYSDNNFSVATGLEAVTFDVKVNGLKEGNTVPVQVTLKVLPGMDPASVTLYHYGNEIDSFYDYSTGNIYFETATFSPFTATYDRSTVGYVPPVTGNLPNDIPVAKVSYVAEEVGVDIPWEEFNGFYPTEGLRDVLDAAFLFECPTLTDEQFAAYKDWKCDFYVSLDQDLKPDQIFLGGMYSDYIVGFHNGNVTLKAGEEIGLLSSVTTLGLTYEFIHTYVQQFLCGVGAVDSSLDGATFTVQLRLTNPENPEEFYNVNTVTYTFGGTYTGTNA